MGLTPMETPMLETETLILRPFTEEDAGFIYELEPRQTGAAATSG
jgi:RimJ/RimL family protein N-acetyltransferase